MLIAAWLDHRVRQETQGRGDLDDALLRMQRNAKRDPQFPVEENLVRSLKKVARWDAAAELDALALEGAQVTMPADLLAPCGMITSSERLTWERGFDFTANSRANWVITGVTETSRAHEAGLRNGMVLKSWSEDSRDLDPSKPKTAEVLDGETLRSLTWLPQGRQTRTVRRLELAPSGEKACQRRLAGN